MADRIAFITGITGQDGTYLTELLLRDGYSVHGLVRGADAAGRLRAEIGDELAAAVHLHVGDLSDGSPLAETVVELGPTEIYNLGAQSHVRDSFDTPARTLEVNAGGALSLLEGARRLHESGRPVRLFQAVSSEIFGSQAPLPWSEATVLMPRSPYGCAKACAFQLVTTYRETYGLFACNGILFNHESPRRGESFVTRKISRAATRIREGLQDVLELGNIDVARDWGYARDYADCMRLMLRHDVPDDYVVATGQTHTLREFLEIAFRRVGLCWKDHVRFPPHLLRPRDVPVVAADASKVGSVLGWSPKVSFEELVWRMVDHDWDLARQERKEISQHAA
ncbi:MAG: GDP-mannose 4,6-dehydratase [Planctomycetaceae bacterium]